ncbi:MAG: DUF3795 domain-containing protein [Chloroflexota bacterium]
MNTLIAACGLDCSKCEAYQATQNNDDFAKERIAAQWRAEYNAPNITIASVTCDGCMTGERHGGYCAECGIRKCAVERNLPNCAYCNDYACEALEGFFKVAPQVRANLETIRAAR